MGIEQLNEAIRLTRKGWVIHPISSPKDTGGSPGKRPLLNSWQKRRKATEAELKEWFEKTDNNMGLVLGKESGILVIDFDKTDWVDVLFPPEQKILERTLKAGRVTGRGHAYFKYTDKIGSQKLREFGIEILTSGNQVVVPPSIHREGQRYKWILPEGADLETFAKEQGVIMSDWINGDTAVLRAERLVEWAQRVIGTGKVFAYIDKEKLNNDLILNQSKEHFLSVIQIAACFIKRNIKVEVNHYDDADVVAWLPDGPVAFEYQTPGSSDPKILTEKRNSSESKYGRLLFSFKNSMIPLRI